MRLLLLILSMLFSNAVYAYSVSGTLFEDYNFGGGIRTYNPSLGMSPIGSTSLQLTGPGVLQYYTTNAAGQYWFSGIPSGSYTLRVLYSSGGWSADGELNSVRGNTCIFCVPVQVYPSATTLFSRTITINGSNVSGQDLGINYSTVLNNNDYGGGSLRQFLVNSRFLDGRNSGIPKTALKQENHVLANDNAILMLGSNQTITLLSPLDMLETDNTSIDARGFNLVLKNHRVAINTDYGLIMNSSDDNYIRGITFDGFDDAIYLRSAENNLFGRNIFKNLRDSGITIWDDSDDNLIVNNIFDNSVNAEDSEIQAAALFITDSNNNEVEKNTFINSGDDHFNDYWQTFHVPAIRVVDSSGTLITKNSFSNSRGISIDLVAGEPLGRININDGFYNSSANRGIDHPVLTGASILINSNLSVQGYVGAGSGSSQFSASTIEIYKAEGTEEYNSVDGTDYIGTCSADVQGNFDCELVIPDDTPLVAGSKLTATATSLQTFVDDDDDDDVVVEYNTSEMGSVIIIAGGEDLTVDIYSTKSTPLTCETSSFNIDIIDQSNNNDLTSYTGDVSVTLSKLSAIGDLSQLCWISDNPAGVGKVSCDQGLVMSFADETSKTVYLESYHQDMQVSAYAEMVDDPSKNDTSGTVEFGSEGFTLEMISSDNQGYKAGISSQLRLTRIESTSGGVPVCNTNERYNGNKDIGFKLSYLSAVVNRASGSIVSENRTTAVNESVFNDAKIKFSSGIATADFYYDEAGKIRLEAYYDPPGHNPNDSIWQQSKTAIFTPYQLRIDEISSGTGSDKKLNPGGNSLSGGGFVAAEVPFDFLLKAYSARNNLVTQNFTTSDGDLLVGVLVLSPASKTGELAQLLPPVNMVFLNGVADLDGFKYKEVGSFYSNFMVTDYLDLTNIGHLSVNSPEVGRFYPDRFELTSQGVTTDFTNAGGYWTYLGKPDIELTYQLEALGADGRRLSYYESGYGVDTIELNLEDRTSGNPISNLTHRLVMPESIAPGGTFTAVWSGGVQTINATGLNALSVAREATGADGPYESSALFLSRISILDAVQFNSSGVLQDTADIGGEIGLRYGRLNIKDTFGPTNTNLPMDMQIEYWDSDSFEVNLWDDGGTALDKDMSHSSDTPSDLSVGFVFDKSTDISEGVYALKVSGDKSGSTLVSNDLVNFPWLQYCWTNSDCAGNNYQNNPLAQAIFGTQRPSDRVIYWQEMFY